VPKIHVPQRVETYFNLHKNCLSFRPPGGRVSHARAMILNNVKFAVQPAGRARVLREGRKNVHAFVRGDMTWAAGLNDNLGDYTHANMERQGYRKITYTPYGMFDAFVMRDSGIPIKSASQVVIIDKTIYLSGTGEH
jgi:hypothetical protein